MKKDIILLFLIFVKGGEALYNRQFFPFGKIPPFGASPFYPYRIDDHPIMPRLSRFPDVSKITKITINF